MRVEHLGLRDGAVRVVYVGDRLRGLRVLLEPAVLRAGRIRAFGVGHLPLRKRHLRARLPAPR